jgi:hypothetical protein
MTTEARYKPMTPVHACQVASNLLKRLETHRLLPDQQKVIFSIGVEELQAIEVLRHVTAQAVTSGRHIGRGRQ